MSPLIFEKHYSDTEAAAYLTSMGLDICAKTVKAERDRGKLGYKRIAGKIRISESQIAAYLEDATCHPTSNTDRSSSENMEIPDTGKSHGTTPEPDKSVGSQPALRRLAMLSPPSKSTI